MRITTSAVIEGNGYGTTANLYINVKAADSVAVLTVGQTARAEAQRYADAVAHLTGYDMEPRGMENTNTRSVDGVVWSYDFFFKVVAA